MIRQMQVPVLVRPDGDEAEAQAAKHVLERVNEHYATQEHERFLDMRIFL